MLLTSLKADRPSLPSLGGMVAVSTLILLIGPPMLAFEFTNIYVSPTVFSALAAFALLHIAASVLLSDFRIMLSRHVSGLLLCYVLIGLASTLIGVLKDNPAFYIITDTFNYYSFLLAATIGLCAPRRILASHVAINLVLISVALRVILRLSLFYAGAGPEYGMEVVAIGGEVVPRVRNPFLAVIGFSFALSALYQRIGWQWLSLLTSVLCAFFIMISYSRGCQVALILSFLVISYVSGRLRISALLPASALVLAAALALPGLSSRMAQHYAYASTQLLAPETAEQATRYIEAYYVFDKLGEGAAWVSGLGFGATAQGNIGRGDNLILEEKHYFHNTYLQILLKHGIIGLLFLGGFFVALIRILLAHMRSNSAMPLSVVTSASAIGFTVAFLIVGLVDPFLRVYPVIAVLGAAFGLCLAASRTRSYYSV